MVVAWSPEDSFFSLGVKALFDRDNSEAYYSENVIVVNLSMPNLQCFLACEEEILLPGSSSVVIISVDEFLLPLAAFLWEKYASVKTVCYKRLPVDVLRTLLSAENVMEEGVTNPPINRLSAAEYRILKLTMSGLDVYSIAKNIKRSTKTVYSLRSNLLKKMNVRHYRMLFL
ncbi:MULTISPECIES: LuxR C-terminal-related transcriptional regulator [unclassified Serratia (in: enterobacteria)]|uniref:helix-turn-helix transcriptional regulator n=1 Tax=unclassified Serratia (in: enterobacteria) TaxID=2647522 RepID=UPI0027F331AC|nr:MULTISPECIES: LuxR C-terminal-related transcriptional regulator [unclassified Serratia (in: enterobacteria)]MDQ7098790.1 LuxR C-terminal-related transcriptional regulator [Serratia sp. MF2]MDQ7102365.1 LuxR C-terminal-related transcriptional regulator [Serratia sp. MF1(2023)]